MCNVLNVLGRSDSELCENVAPALECTYQKLDRNNEWVTLKKSEV